MVRKIYRNEIWKPIVGFHGYNVSDYSSVRSYWKQSGKLQSTVQRILSPRIDSSGYKFVTLFKDGIRKHVPIHRLVLESFVGPCPEGMQACHNDGDPSNNYISNLRWDTPKNNGADKIKHGTSNKGEKCHLAKLTEAEVLKIRKLYLIYKQCELALMFGVSVASISRIVNNKMWLHI